MSASCRPSPYLWPLCHALLWALICHALPNLVTPACIRTKGSITIVWKRAWGDGVPRVTLFCPHLRGQHYVQTTLVVSPLQNTQHLIHIFINIIISNALLCAIFTCSIYCNSAKPNQCAVDHHDSNFCCVSIFSLSKSWGNDMVLTIDWALLVYLNPFTPRPAIPPLLGFFWSSYLEVNTWNKIHLYNKYVSVLV